MPALNVWMNGELVGEWTTSRRGTPIFRYTEQWAQSPRARALSLSLPLTADRQIRGPAVDYYFDNLLPDNPDIRRRIRDQYGLGSTDPFELLQEIGRDCVGAVQLLPPDQVPTGWDRIEAQPLSEADVERRLRQLLAPTPLTGRDAPDEFRISLAGAQEKTALLYMGGTWMQPLHSTPTTHILKLPLGVVGNFRGDFTHSVENEWFCAQLLTEVGILVAETEMATFGEQRALIVKRFDRRWVHVTEDAKDQPGYTPRQGHWIARLPQEDFCQATGRPPAKRYESEGGPSVDEILLILANAEHPENDRRAFVLAQLSFWLLAATDGHSKNFSISHRAGSQFGLTPLYDVLSAWPIIGSGANQLPLPDVKLSMAISGRHRHYRIAEIQARHWSQLALRVGGPELWRAATDLVTGADVAIERVLARLPAGFPASVADAIAAGVRAQRRRFIEGLSDIT
jgi:serine/threonine-protein kinase HipA